MQKKFSHFCVLIFNVLFTRYFLLDLPALWSHNYACEVKMCLTAWVSSWPVTWRWLCNGVQFRSMSVWVACGLVARMVEIEMCGFNFFWIIIMIQASARFIWNFEEQSKGHLPDKSWFLLFMRMKNTATVLYQTLHICSSFTIYAKLLSL